MGPRGRHARRRYRHAPGRVLHALARWRQAVRAVFWFVDDVLALRRDPSRLRMLDQRRSIVPLVTPDGYALDEAILPAAAARRSACGGEHARQRRRRFDADSDGINLDRDYGSLGHSTTGSSPTGLAETYGPRRRLGARDPRAARPRHRAQAGDGSRSIALRTCCSTRGDRPRRRRPTPRLRVERPDVADDASRRGRHRRALTQRRF